MAHITKQNKDLTATIEGGNIVISFQGNKLFAIRQSDNQFLVQLGIDTDVTL